MDDGGRTGRCFVRDYRERCRSKYTATSTGWREFPSQRLGGRQARDNVIFTGELERNVSTSFDRQGRDRLTTHTHGCSTLERDVTESVCQEESLSVTIKRQNKTLKNMREDIVSWIVETGESVKCLRELADEVDAVFKGANKAKVGGSAAAIAGGIVSIVGFGLSFVTFGTSLILCIVGGAVAGAGGITTGTASVVDSVKTSSKKKLAEATIKRYNDKLKRIKEECIEIADFVDGGQIDTLMPEWVQFWATFSGLGSVAANAGWSVIGKTIVNSLKLSGDFALDAASSVGKTAFRAAGTAARGAHIAGGVVGILLLPLDVHTLVTSAIDLGKGNVHKVAAAIREAADNIEKECPSVQDVDNMIECTIPRLENHSRAEWQQQHNATYSHSQVIYQRVTDNVNN